MDCSSANKRSDSWELCALMKSGVWRVISNGDLRADGVLAEETAWSNRWQLGD